MLNERFLRHVAFLRTLGTLTSVSSVRGVLEASQPPSLNSDRGCVIYRGPLEIWRESELFNDRERVALDYAEAVTHSDQQVEDDVAERLKRFFDDDSVVELTGLIASQNMSSKFNSALAIPAQGFCHIPDC